MRVRKQQLGVFALAALAALAACNGLTGAGDLTFGACEGCEENEGGIRVDGALVDGQGPGPGSDGSTDGPAGDTSKEGPGGALDTTFGVGGFVVIDPLLDPRAVAVRADGRIVVVGQNSNDLTAVAFTPIGAVDLTFGNAGRIMKGQGNSSFGVAVAFDSQGRAVVAGSSVTVTTVSTHFAYVVRIGASQVDATFNGGGSFRGGNGGEDAVGIALTADDGMVLAVSGGKDYQFFRLTAGGTPDNAFGDQGRSTINNIGGDPTGIAAQADGFVMGGYGNSPTGQAYAATKVSLTGLPVSAFGTLGKAYSKVSTNNNEDGLTIAAQADGKVLIGGDYDPNVAMLQRVTAVTRLTSNGQVDTTYAAAGKLAIDLTESLVGRETGTRNTNLVLDSKGRALVVGNVTDKLIAGGDRARGWVARIRADGTLDPLFAGQGKLLLGTPPAQLEVRGAALQADGKLVVVGIDHNGNKLFLARIITSTIL